VTGLMSGGSGACASMTAANAASSRTNNRMRTADLLRLAIPPARS
jgi:hypothetical protein